MRAASRLLFFLIYTSTLWGQNMISLEARSVIAKVDDFETKFVDLNWQAAKTAIIVCDMWDQHWCATATQRVGEMAPRMNDFIAAARTRGVTIVHAPSNTMKYYDKYPQRDAMRNVAVAASSKSIEDWYYLDPELESALPIDDTDGGCDDPGSDCVHCEVWSKQIEILDIKEGDLISDSGIEINNYFTLHGIENVMLVGVHTNMCVLGRSFGIRSQIHLGRNVVLVRDLTDTMYNPKAAPYVSHQEGTDLVINHVEKYWCPTITSDQLLNQ